MAGTTVNENNLVYKTLQKCINRAGFNFSLEEVIWLGAGKEKLQATKDILKSKVDDETTVDKVAANIYDDFSVELENQYRTTSIGAFESVKTLFKHLREQDISIVLNTGYNRKIAELILGKLEWNEGKEIDLMVTSDEVENGRPNPDMILYAMRHLGISDSSKVVKIGDSIIDIEEGQSANCGLVIGVTTGAHNSDQLLRAQPDFVIDSLEEVKTILARLHSESI